MCLLSLQPDPFFENLTFEQFSNLIPELYFRKEVPEDVVKNFEIVNELLRHSYYQYKFIDEAYSKALYSLEMAFKIRLQDFCILQKKISFHHLIEELFARNLFDTNHATLMSIKNMRNHFAHPTRHSFGGTVYWNRIELICRIINELYEDVQLRQERQMLFSQFCELQKINDIHSYCSSKINTRKIDLFNFRLLFINNKRNPHSYLIAYTPLFDLNSESDLGGIVPIVEKCKIIKPTFSNREMNAITSDKGEPVTFSEQLDNSNFHYFWKERYEAKKIKFIYESSILHMYSEIYVPVMQNFHKMQ